MRRYPLAVLVVVVTLSLVGCGRLSQQGPIPLPDDLLFLRSGKGITLVDALSGGAATRLPSSAVPSTDFSTVVQAQRYDGGTELTAIDVGSGDELWTRQLPGRSNFEVKVASTDGRMVALGPRTVTYSGYPRGRTTTPLLIVDQASAGPRRIELEGNYLPEAFSTDGRSLFVIEYVPPQRPTAYRVRRLDLVTEEVVGVYTVDQELQDRMQGTARIQAASSDGTRLYTLYTIGPPYSTGAPQSFIHVLALDELWAHCIDLPSEFGLSDQRGMALTVTQDGSRLYVTDGASDTLAEVDAAALAVTRTTSLDIGPPAAGRYAAYGANGVLYIASRNDLVALDAQTLETRDSWYYPVRIKGLQVGSDGRRLYVGVPEGISVIDTATGEALSMLRPEHVGRVALLGESTTLEEEQTTVSCAC